MSTQYWHNRLQPKLTVWWRGCDLLPPHTHIKLLRLQRMTASSFFLSKPSQQFGTEGKNPMAPVLPTPSSSLCFSLASGMVVQWTGDRKALLRISF